MKKNAKIAVIGTSGRGMGNMEQLLGMDDVVVPAVCDLYQDRADNAAKRASEAQGITVEAYTDYKKLLERDDIDGVIIPASWSAHAYIAVAAMNAGKYAAVECGGACSIDECWQLVRASEKTGMPCMFLENCCYGREEMTLLRMIRTGVFGELIHTQGGYEHDLRNEVAFGRENRHYRFDNYLHRNADLYPAHGLGPISKYLSVNRGNRMLTLTSMSTKSRGLHEYINKTKGEDYDMANAHFCQGDVVTTMIKCANGETILLTHDTTLPRPYSRGGRVQGTKGIWMEDNYSIYIDGVSQNNDVWEKFDSYIDDSKYEHPLWTEFRNDGVKGGHGGMDYLVFRAFVESIINETNTPIDVYDAALWMSITALSEDSIALGSVPVVIPDFTDGKWIKRDESIKSKYSLDKVDLDLFK